MNAVPGESVALKTQVVEILLYEEVQLSRQSYIINEDSWMKVWLEKAS